MLTTAKSIQLLDASGLNISPITDITSLYYEVPNAIDNKIVSRKYVYDGFPVGVNITNDSDASIGVATNDSNKRHPDAGYLYYNGNYKKIVNEDKKDILVSNVSTSIIPGTTYRLINIYNYNLSNILSYYTPLDLLDASIHSINASIDIVNSSIRNVSTRINNISTGLYAESKTLTELLNLRTISALIPNKFYLINNYYVSLGSDGCMDLPNPATDFSGPTSSSSLSLLVKANDSANLDRKLYEMYDHSGNALKVYGTYKIENNKVHIIYMKDQYGNEAPYDFYNLKYNGGSGNTYYWTYNYDSSNMLMDENTKDKVKNNIIKTDPFESNTMPIFSCKLSINSEIRNNYIGNNNIINIYARMSSISIINNIILNNNNILLNGTTTVLENSIINNNNNFNFNIGFGTYNNLYINNSNIIKHGGNGVTQTIKNLFIENNNNITLINLTNNETRTNITVLNNCDGSINLSDNIVVDGYINAAVNASLNTEPNSVYLFKLNVYAKSFNTLN